MAIKNIITVGMQYGWLFPLHYIKHDKGGNQIWECVCHCGERIFVRARSLVVGNTRSCGCYNKSKKDHKKKSRVAPASKVCVKCRIEKPIEKFYLRRESGLHRDDCAECNVSMATGWVSKNFDRVKEYKEKWLDDNRERVTQDRRKYWRENSARLNADAAPRKKEYRESNRAACNARSKEWKKRNPGSVAFYSRTRQARLREAIPPWADLDKVEALYIESDRISKETGVRHHVDHIVPLIGRGGLVCGLHCEQNLRIITAEENLKKNGYHWPDMP